MYAGIYNSSFKRQFNFYLLIFNIFEIKRVISKQYFSIKYSA